MQVPHRNHQRLPARSVRAAVCSWSATLTDTDPNQSPVDFYWFYRAVDRSLVGKDLSTSSGQALERELADAQALTEQYLACVRAGTKVGTCAKQVDPKYEGWKSAEQP